MLAATGLTARERAWNAMERVDKFEDFARPENPMQDECGIFKQTRRMSTSFAQRAHERIPSCPHSVPPVKGRRYPAWSITHLFHRQPPQAI